uniref:Uncharacterized protein n=1 Tax=Anguilla anguilla TaxID=7936 RepID=A0A0E9XG40_ANGAN
MWRPFRDQSPNIYQFMQHLISPGR